MSRSRQPRRPNSTDQLRDLMTSAKSGNPEIIRQKADEMGRDLNSVYVGGNTLLTKAIEDNEAPSTVEAIIRAGADVNYPNSQGKTALMTAVIVQRPELLKVLIEYGADPKLKTPKHISTISLCLKRERYSYLEILLRQSMNNVDSMIKNLKEICLYLRGTNTYKDWNTSDFVCSNLTVDPRLISAIKNVYDVNLNDMNGTTPLMYAVRCHYDNCVRLLLLAGVDVNRINKSKETALTLAMTRSHNPILKDLIRAGALRRHPRGKTSSLHFGMFKMILDFLQQNGLFKMPDIYGKTALMYAAERRDKECIIYAVKMDIEEFRKSKFLLDSKETSARCLDRGYDTEAISSPCEVKESQIRCRDSTHIHWEDNRRGHSTIIYAIQCCHFLNEAITKLLVGDTHKEQYQDGKTALMIAVSGYNGGSHTYIEPLIGDTCSIQDNDGKTALMYAFINKLVPEDLLKQMIGDSQNMQDKYGKTALMYAFIHKKLLSGEMIELLAGETPFIQDNDGKTALMYAFEHSQILTYSCMQKLFGGRVDICDIEGDTTLIYALKYDLNLTEEIISLLVGDRTTEKYQNGQTALMIALKLYDKNLKINSHHNYDIGGETTTYYHSDYNAGLFLKPLMKDSCSIQDEDGKTALMYALMNTNGISNNILKMMIGDSQNVQDKYGKTALMYAFINKQRLSQEMIWLLAGEAPFIQDNAGKTALMYAFEYNQFLTYSCIQKLLGGKVDIRDNKGNTTLIYALKYDPNPKEEIISLLVCDRATEKYHNGQTALMIALQLYNKNLNRHNSHCNIFLRRSDYIQGHFLKPLVGKSCRIQDNGGKTALMYALMEKKGVSENILKMMVGDSQNIQDNEGKTALHHAIIHQETGEYIEQLILHGSNLEIEDKQKRTALVLCLELDTCYAASPYDRRETFIKTKMILKYNPMLRLNLLGKMRLLKSIENCIFSLYGLFKNKEIFRLMIVNGIVPFPHLSENISTFFTILRENMIDVVKYLIANMYLTNEDLMLLIQAKNYLKSDDYQRKHQMLYNGTYLDLSSTDLQHLVTEATSQPWPLVKLSFVVVSSAVGHGTNREDRVNRLPLPNAIKDSLMFNTRTALIPVNEWSNIPIVFDPVEYEKTRRPRPLLNYWPFGTELVV